MCFLLSVVLGRLSLWFFSFSCSCPCSHQFVRIRPNSILESLYPCSQHSSDRCIWCGHTFREHLEHWAQPYTNTSYSKLLDIVYEEALEKGEAFSQALSSNARTKRSKNLNHNSSNRRKSGQEKQRLENKNLLPVVYDYRYFVDATKQKEMRRSPNAVSQFTRALLRSLFLLEMFNLSDFQEMENERREKAAENNLCL